jgi:hypothetical protein
MQTYFFSLAISYQQYLDYYAGSANTISVTTETGIRLQLPAAKFRPFVSQLGLRGRFRLRADQNNKFISLEVW